MLQNATPLRKSAPWPPNISDEHVSCTAPATRNPSFQILFKCPTPAIVFGTATNPHVLLIVGKMQNPSRLPRKTTSEPSKVVRACGAFSILTWTRAPRHKGVHFRHLNLQKCSKPGVLCTFWLQNVLRATTACTCSTSPLLKVLRGWGALYILTSKCASHDNGVHFFDITICKSAPRLRCFVHFDFEMCFARQRRALFRHLNFENCSETEVFCMTTP